MLKNHKILKSLSLLTALALVITVFAAGAAYGGDDVVINAENFPDANWRAVVDDWFNEEDEFGEKDNVLSAEEISGVTLISVPGMLEDTCGEDAEISDLTGIEHFTALKRLRCGGIGLETLDISAMPQLVELTCNGNDLATLDISHNTALTWLNCSGNELDALNLTANTALTRLDCYANHLTDINLAPLTNLTTLRLQQNEFTTLDISYNTALTTFNCSNNHLRALDLSANTGLEDITEYNIGSQTISVEAEADGDRFFVPLAIPNSDRIVSTSLDTSTVENDVVIFTPGYNGTEFVCDDINRLVNGIDYDYDTRLAGAETMNVHINVIRNFYRVRFFSDLETVAKTVVVNSGADATALAPELEPPVCKLFNCWDEDLTNITADTDAYALWDDNHHIGITAFTDGELFLNCTYCHEHEEAFTFEELLHAREGDSNYVAQADRNNDGVVNGRDYVLLKRIK